jgi:hypothetical protein
MLLMTEAHHKAYCNRWNATYQNIDKRIPQNKRPHWQKVTLIDEALYQGYDQIMWLDADAVIVRPSVDIFSYAGPDISICECFASPTIERHYNTGFILLRNTDLVREFVAMWDAMPDTGYGWADQAGAINLINNHKRFRNAITTLPNAFNCVPTHMDVPDPIIRSAHGRPDKVELVARWLTGIAGH